MRVRAPGGVLNERKVGISTLAVLQASERHALEDDLHIKYGHQLFAAGEYEQAMVRPLHC